MINQVDLSWKKFCVFNCENSKVTSRQFLEGLHFNHDCCFPKALIIHRSVINLILIFLLRQAWSPIDFGDLFINCLKDQKSNDEVASQREANNLSQPAIFIREDVKTVCMLEYFYEKTAIPLQISFFVQLFSCSNLLF